MIEKIELFAKNSEGKIQEWSAVANDFGYTIAYGLRNGAQTTRIIYVPEGKANRSVKEQIHLEMESRAKVKRDLGYVSSLEKAVETTRTTGKGFALPMLASPTKHKKIILHPDSQVQIKYNGLRCLVTNIGGVNYAYSKTGILYPALHNLVSHIVIPEGETIDGEVYLHGVSLQRINSLAKRKQRDTDKLRYHCYDVVMDDEYNIRMDYIINNIKFGGVGGFVPTQPLAAIPNLLAKFKEVRAEGYEGLIVRQPGYGYQSGKRNKAMYKFKQFLDDEFKVVDIEQSRDGWAILVCEVPNTTKTFKVSAPGTLDEKKDILQRRHDFIGKWVTVEFAEYSDSGIPLQPVALHFRGFE